VPIKTGFCASSVWILLLKRTEIEKTYSYATRQAAMATLEIMYLSGLGSDKGGSVI